MLLKHLLRTKETSLLLSLLKGTCFTYYFSLTKLSIPALPAVMLKDKVTTSAEKPVTEKPKTFTPGLQENMFETESKMHQEVE